MRLSALLHKNANAVSIYTLRTFSETEKRFTTHTSTLGHSRTTLNMISLVLQMDGAILVVELQLTDQSHKLEHILFFHVRWVLNTFVFM